MTDTQLDIRLARYGDADAIARLSRDAIEQGLGWSWRAEKVARSIRNADTNVCVASIDGDFAGFGIMYYGDEKANLQLLAVKSQYRRQGVARAIVLWLETVALDAGVRKLTVQLRVHNQAAYDFYSNLQFESVGRVSGYYRGKEPALLMAKHIGVRDGAT